jgi:ferredoxin
MSELTITVKSIEVTEPTLLEFFEGKGMTLPKQCLEGYCGTCRCQVSNPDAFEEVYEQLGWREEKNEVLLCSVKFKNLEESDFIFPEPPSGSESYIKPLIR